MVRIDGRTADSIRRVTFKRGFTKYGEGSVLIGFGDTKVICTATIEENIPPFRKGTGSGWVTAEYSMLPRATHSRNVRDVNRLKLNPRSVEIQRLISRALRNAVDLHKLGERSVIVDCDVIQADGGTRTASITGGFVALYDACQTLVERSVLPANPVVRYVSAVSVGVVNGKPLLDLCYEEDSAADVDMNIILNSNQEFVEVQGTGENAAFSRDMLTTLTDLGIKGCNELIALQKVAIAGDKNGGNV